MTVYADGEISLADPVAKFLAELAHPCVFRWRGSNAGSTAQQFANQRLDVANLCKDFVSESTMKLDMEPFGIDW